MIWLSKQPRWKKALFWVAFTAAESYLVVLITSLIQ